MAYEPTNKSIIIMNVMYVKESAEFKYGSGVENGDELEDIILREREIARKAWEVHSISIAL